jgi:predicted dehydrogenase
MRYTRHYSLLREIVHSGRLGQIVTIDHRENVSFYHMAHSFVRGNWRNRAESSPMILAKCCHDLDMLVWLLDGHCESLSSVGGLMHYRAENAPAGAPLRCLDGCPVADECPYYAPFIYLDLEPMRRISEDPAAFNPAEYRGWPASVVALDPTPANVRAALETGPYGRCVYHCDNDVVDHQAVSMRFSGGQSVTLTMHGHSNMEGRTSRIQGSRAELHSFSGSGMGWIEIREHRSGEITRIETALPGDGGHGGGDEGLAAALVESIRGSGAGARTTARQALESHLMAFAAEEARLTGRVIDMREFAR